MNSGLARRGVPVWAWGAVLFSFGPSAAAGTAAGDSILALEVMPRAVDLAGPFAFQRLVVLGVEPDGSRTDLTRLARVTSLDPAVVSAGEIDGEGRPALLPAGAGEGKVRVEWKGRSADVSVHV